MSDWKVVRGRFIFPDGKGMQATCHHKRAGACGGCYARLAMALEEIERRPLSAKSIARAVGEALVAEGAAKKRRKAK